MENLELVLSLATAALVLLSAAVSFLIKLIGAIKEKDAEKVKNLLSEAAREAVAFAEAVKGVSGDTKKAIALTRINQKLIESGAKYDEQAASDAVERVISLSKEVNAKPGGIVHAVNTEATAIRIAAYEPPAWTEETGRKDNNE